MQEALATMGGQVAEGGEGQQEGQRQPTHAGHEAPRD
jgi:hypothetical protein